MLCESARISISRSVIFPGIRRRKGTGTGMGKARWTGRGTVMWRLLLTREIVGSMGMVTIVMLIITRVLILI